MRENNRVSGAGAGPIKLLRHLCQAGIASRRECFAMVRGGKVKINGTVTLEPGTPVRPKDAVSVDDKPVQTKTFRYVMLNKPRGYLCALSDPRGEKLAADLIDMPGVRLFSAGRLDRDSEGLLIFTNDGDYADALTHPRNEVQKSYEALVSRPLREIDIQRMTEGVEDEGEILRALEVVPLGECRYRFVLNEGKKREIRRLVKMAGAIVKRLNRVAIGALRLGDLRPGKWRELSPADVRLALAKPTEKTVRKKTPGFTAKGKPFKTK